jgi:putative ABC transport system permease protein
MIALTLALRNLWKNRRRSVATLLAIAVGFTAVNLFAGYIHVVYQSMRSSAIRSDGLGHVTIAKRGFFARGSLDPARYIFSAAELQRLDGVVQGPRVALISPRLAVSGLISNGRVSTIFIADGERPDDANALRQPAASVARLDPGKPNSGLIGKRLAEMLGATSGSNLVVLTSTLAGQTNALDLDVAAIWDTGVEATNDKSLRLPLAFVQKLLDTDGASRVAVLLDDDAADAERYRAELAPRLAAAGFDVDLKTWIELSSWYRQVKNLFDMIFIFVFSIVFVVVLMSIVNTLSMSVMERVREIGTLRALGMKKGGIVRLFAVEGALLGAIGCLAGAGLSVSLATLINLAGISYTPPSSSAAVTLSVAVLPGMLLASASALALVAMLAALWPARRAAHIEIVDALGHV